MLLVDGAAPQRRLAPVGEGGQRPVKVYDPFAGKEVELYPLKVWSYESKTLGSIKVGLFRSPTSGKLFRAVIRDPTNP